MGWNLRIDVIQPSFVGERLIVPVPRARHRASQEPEWHDPPLRLLANVAEMILCRAG